MTNLVENPASQEDNVNYGFSGLKLNDTNSDSFLDGDPVSGCYFWSVGEANIYGSGIPSFQSPGDLDGTPQAELWARASDGGAFADASQ